MGGGINEIEDKIDFIELNIPWGTVGTHSCPEGTYQRISNDIQNDRIIRLTGTYNILTLREGSININNYAIYYSIGEHSFAAEFSSDDTVEISPWDKIILNKNNWAGGTLQFTEEGIYNLLRTAITRYIPVYVTANSEYAILQYLDVTTTSLGSGISGRYVIESQRTLRTIDMFVTTEDEVYLTIVNIEQLSNPI